VATDAVPSYRHAMRPKAFDICRDFLHFRAAYYQVDAWRSSRGRTLVGQLAAFLRLRENYDEVRSELERLEQIENQQVERSLQGL
jgi:hypothetical protein